MTDEYTSDFHCSHCEMPIFFHEEEPVEVWLSPFCGVFFCDLMCLKGYMEDFTHKDMQEINEMIHRPWD